MKFRIRLLSLTLIASLGLAACGEPPAAEPTSAATAAATEKAADEAKPTEEAKATEAADDAKADADKKEAGEVDGKDYKACLVSDAGGWDDKSFNQSAMEGLQDAIKEYNVQSATAESEGDADFAPNVDNMVQEGCDLIIGVGFLLEQPVEDAARANPDINFGLVDSAFTDDKFEPVHLDNARPLLFNTAEAAYLAGYVAAGVSKSKKVGTYGGMKIPSVSIFMDGLSDGIDRWNKDNNDTVQLIGWDKAKQDGSFAGNFDDIAAGKTLTEGFIAQGADVIMPVAGPLGNGTAAAAEAAGNVKVIWVDSDGFLSAPEHKGVIITSVVKKIGASVQDAIRHGIEGSFDGKAYVGTLANGGVDLAPFHDHEGDIPDAVKEGVAKIKQEIIDGKTVVESVATPKS